MPQLNRRMLSVATLSALVAFLVKRRKPQPLPEGTWKDVTPLAESPEAEKSR